MLEHPPLVIASHIAMAARWRPSPDGMVPDLDGPVGAAGHEHLGVEVVPLDRVHRHVVSLVGLQELAGVDLGALEDTEVRATQLAETLDTAIQCVCVCVCVGLRACVCVCVLKGY